MMLKKNRVRRRMKILIVTDIDNPGLKEDCLIAKSFIKDGHHVTLTREDYDEQLDELFDTIVIRNIWHLDSRNYEEYKNKMLCLRKRLKRKKIPTINLYGKFDDSGKLYLKELYDKGYPVIPTTTNLADFKEYDEKDIFLLKPIDGYEGYGIIEMLKNEIEVNPNYIVQPKVKFTKEVEFYFINKDFQFVLEFVPSKKPVYPIPNLYNYTDEELKIAQDFANLCDDKFVGVQRIDFLKTKEGILLLEIGDSSPYLNLNSLDEKVRNDFLENFKNMVYKYYNSYHNVNFEKGSGEMVSLKESTIYDKNKYRQ